MRVLLAGGGTGGHLMPALALAQALREARPDVEPVLVGALRGIVAQVLPRHPFRFHLVPIEPIHRRAWWRNLRWPLVAWRAWRAAGRILAAERPAVVIGTGRSEEHTSELQSLAYLVCRLLLEKKKIKKPRTTLVSTNRSLSRAPTRRKSIAH